MKTQNALSIAIVFLAFSACGDSTTRDQARNNQENDANTPVALTQLAEDIFQMDENSPPVDFDQTNLDLEEDKPNTDFDYLFPATSQ